MTKKRKRLWLSVLAFLLVGTAVLFYLRWNAWFGNRPEAAYRTPSAIDRITLVPGSDFAKERRLSWRSGETLRPSYVELLAMRGDSVLSRQKIAASGQIVSTRGGKGAFYTALLPHLEAATRYCYRLTTGNERSEVFSFEMPALAALEQETRFLYIGDVQDPTGAMSNSLMRQLKDSVSPVFRPHFLVGAGDQIDAPTDECWNVWYKALNHWNATLPMIFATGNHEYYKRGFARELDPRWVAQYGYPNNSPKGFEQRSYYIDLPLLRIIVLDTTDMNGLPSFFRHRSWLQTALTSSKQPWQVVVFHHATRCVRKGRSNEGMKWLIEPILEQYGADLVLQGHDHAYSRRMSRTNEGEMRPPLYLISSSSPKLYRASYDAIHDRCGEGMQLYQTLRITPDLLDYRAYQYGKGLYDQVSLRKRPVARS